MTKKYLGKIKSAEYGFISDYPFLMGLKLEFQLGDNGMVGDGGKFTVNMSDECEWDSAKQRAEVIAERCDAVYKLLNDAKTSNVSGLKNKPVEVTLEDNCFKDFRILTEVL